MGDTVVPGGDSGTDATSQDVKEDITSTDAGGDGDAAAPWTPSVLDGAGSLALWLEASATNVVISSGYVEQWTDLSKNHNNATNSKIGASIAAAAVNGHDAVAFTLWGVTLAIPDAPSLDLATDQFFIMAVARVTIPNLYLFSKAHTQCFSGCIFHTGLELYTTNNFYDASAGLYPLAHYGEDPYDSGTVSYSQALWNGPVFDDGKFHIVGLRRTNPSTLVLFADDQPPQTTNGLDSYSLSEGDAAVNVGSPNYGNKGGQTIDSDVAELVVVHKPGGIIADATVTSLHDYLKAKYAL